MTDPQIIASQISQTELYSKVAAYTAGVGLTAYLVKWIGELFRKGFGYFIKLAFDDFKSGLKEELKEELIEEFKKILSEQKNGRE